MDESCESDVTETGNDDNIGANCKVVLEWHPDAEKSLRQRYGSGSRAFYRQKNRQASLQREAAQHYSIKELFKRQETIGREHDEASKVVPLSEIAHGRSTELSLERSMAENARLAASEDLKRLLQLPTVQKKKYG